MITLARKQMRSGKSPRWCTDHPSPLARGRADEAQPHAVGVTLAILGFYGPWVTTSRNVAALTYNALDLAEFSKFIVRAHGGTMTREMFLVPVVAAALALALWASQPNQSLACPALYAHFRGGRFHSRPPAPLSARHVSVLILVACGLPLCRRPRIVLVERCRCCSAWHSFLRADGASWGDGAASHLSHSR